MNFPILQKLQIQFKASESRRKLYEVDLHLFCQQIQNCTQLESLELDLNQEITLNQKAAASLVQSCIQLQRLQTLKINHC